jgi:hypothetical protein
MENHAALIDDLGGGTLLAEAVFGSVGPGGKHREAVYKWKRNGIPWRWRLRVQELAQERGIPLPPGFLSPSHNGSPQPSIAAE